MVLALLCDGVYGPYQNKIINSYKPSAYHLMFNMNFWEGMVRFNSTFYKIIISI